MATTRGATAKAVKVASSMRLDPLGTFNDTAAVRKLQRALKDKGFNPGAIDGLFGNGTQAAVMAFQLSEGLLADGVVGPRTAAALAGDEDAASQPLPSVIGEGNSEKDCAISVGVASQMFPHTQLANIKANLPFVLDALREQNLQDKIMVLASLATIRAETERFIPISEGISRYNTSPDGSPFDLYDHRRDLGNQGPPDGAGFCGRGYIQLTGRYNYAKYGARLGLDLLATPDLANQPDVAGRLLAAFMSDKEKPIKEALIVGDYARARRLVNGGSHGLDRFAAAYRIGFALIG